MIITTAGTAMGYMGCMDGCVVVSAGTEPELTLEQGYCQNTTVDTERSRKMLTKEEREVIREIDEFRTQGEWSVSAAYIVRDKQGSVITIPAGSRKKERRNATFIAACSTAIPALLDALDEMEQALRFYADNENWIDGPPYSITADDGNQWSYCEIAKVTGDKGALARAALGEES